MWFRRLRAFLPLLTLLGGFPCFAILQLLPVAECRGETLVNIKKPLSYAAEADLEQELLMLTNLQRNQEGLQVLVPDEALTQIAREHSSGMAKQGFISHDQPSGSLQIRMDRAGYLYEMARENVAMARTVSIAQNLFIRSPKHRNNMLAANATRVGIGIVRPKSPYDTQLFITEIFAAPREEYSPVALQNLALDRVNDLRSQSGSASIQPDPLFENLAMRSVSSLEVPVDRKDLRRLLQDSADELISKGRTELARLDVSVQLLHNPKNLSIPDQAGEKGAGIFGTAVRQVTDSQNRAAFLVLTLIGFTH